MSHKKITTEIERSRSGPSARGRDDPGRREREYNNQW